MRLTSHLQRRSRSATFLAIPIAIGCVSHAMKPPVPSEPFGDIAGFVRDSASGEMVGGASVRLEGIDAIRTDPTNDLGKFRLSHVPSGKHTLVLRRIGYGAKRIPVAIEAGRTRSISVSMSRLGGCDIGCDESSIVTANPPGVAAIPNFRPDSITTGNNGERLAALVGTVVDSDTGRSLEGSTVVLRPKGTNKIDIDAYADPRGGFVIGRVKPGPYRIIVRHIGWIVGSQDWDARAGKIDKVQFRLLRAPVEFPVFNR